MGQEVDVVVVGSGPSGSIAGAYLAKGGLKTVVFEQDDNIGGMKYGSYTFGDGFRSDRHIHIPMWHMTLNGGGGWWPKAAKEVGAPIRWTCLPNTALHLAGNNFIVPYCASGHAFVKFLVDMSPFPISEHTQKEFERIMDEIITMPQREVWSAKSDTTPFIQWLKSRTDDESVELLIRIFAHMLVVVPPETCLEQCSITAIVGTLLQGLTGAGMNLAAVLGGTSDDMLKAFCGVTTQNGGEVLTGHRVIRGVIKGKEAKGVVVLTPGGKEEMYHAKYVILASGYTALPAILGEHLPETIRQTIAGFEEHHNIGIDVHFALRRQALNPGTIVYMGILSDEMKPKGHIAFPSHWEPRLAPYGKQMVWTEKFVPKEEFLQRTKEEWIQEMTDMVEGVFPGFKDEIEATSFQAYGPAVQYFFTAIRKIPMECPGISGLYFVGDYVAPPARGIATERAASSATMISKRILRREGKLAV